ncbi:MAG: hypothetical protein IJ529_05240 [Alphaproteobacteria bacterium]|nr:hypothetical protein [Alphaproteobacteria bacterium]MBQ9235963.1 hypothetical protein [Alphaproteobacteria bacterium]
MSLQYRAEKLLKQVKQTKNDVLLPKLKAKAARYKSRFRKVTTVAAFGVATLFGSNSRAPEDPKVLQAGQEISAQNAQEFDAKTLGINAELYDRDDLQKLAEQWKLSRKPFHLPDGISPDDTAAVKRAYLEWEAAREAVNAARGITTPPTQDYVNLELADNNFMRTPWQDIDFSALTIIQGDISQKNCLRHLVSCDCSGQKPEDSLYFSYQGSIINQYFGKVSPQKVAMSRQNYEKIKENFYRGLSDEYNQCRMDIDDVLKSIGMTDSQRYQKMAQTAAKYFASIKGNKYAGDWMAKLADSPIVIGNGDIFLKLYGANVAKMYKLSDRSFYNICQTPQRDFAKVVYNYMQNGAVGDVSFPKKEPDVVAQHPAPSPKMRTQTAAKQSSAPSGTASKTASKAPKKATNGANSKQEAEANLQKLNQQFLKQLNQK